MIFVISNRTSWGLRFAFGGRRKWKIFPSWWWSVFGGSSYWSDLSGIAVTLKFQPPSKWIHQWTSSCPLKACFPFTRFTPCRRKNALLPVRLNWNALFQPKKILKLRELPKSATIWNDLVVWGRDQVNNIYSYLIYWYIYTRQAVDGNQLSLGWGRCSRRFLVKRP